MDNENVHRQLVELRETVHAGFARMDRYFELQQAQHLELRGEVQELRDQVLALTLRLDRIEQRLTALENEVRTLRDWVTRELAEVRGEIRLLRREAAERDAGLRGEIAALGARVTELERRLDDGPS
jgi:SMC interacting uncharacterized protein involved in chromosome segregation